MAATKDYTVIEPPKPKPEALAPSQKCAVEENADGAVVHFRIDAQEWSRLKRRMANQDPAMFMWENHIHRMIDGAIY